MTIPLSFLLKFSAGFSTLFLWEENSVERHHGGGGGWAGHLFLSGSPEMTIIQEALALQSDP